MKSPTIALECQLFSQGLVHIAGLDEVGRGAWAGPVVAAAVILPLYKEDSSDSTRRLSIRIIIPEELSGVRDSKLLSPRRREELYDIIIGAALAVGTGVVEPEEIDAKGIIPATHQAMRLAMSELAVAPQYLLIDYLVLPDVETPQQAIVHGDVKCLSIAAASIIAKVHRDRLMVDLDDRYSGYGFARNKGYGTPFHQEALTRLGPSPMHRLSWTPCTRLG